MNTIIPAVETQKTHEACQLLRQARNLPDLFDRAASIFLEASGATYTLIYLAVSDDEAIELAYAGDPPPRSRELPWLSSLDPESPVWLGLGASEIRLIEHHQRPYALVAIGPRGTSRTDTQADLLRTLCATTEDVLAQTLLETRALAAEFQEQLAKRHHQQAKWLYQRLRQVSHDFRNHLVPMLYATEELQEILQQPDALKVLIGLERQILLAEQLSKQSLTPLTAAPMGQRTDLTAVVQEIAEAWQGLLARHDQTLSVSLPSRAVWVAGTPTQHHRILGNLVSNANKFTPCGGAIRLSLTVEDGHCLLEVSDSGRGIGPLVRRRLFASSVREHPQIEGHGIGLTSCQAILEDLGGSITVKSEPGRGSTFHVRLSALPPLE